MTPLGKRPFSVEQGGDTAAGWWDLAEEPEKSGLVLLLLFSLTKIYQNAEEIGSKKTWGLFAAPFLIAN